MFHRLLTAVSAAAAMFLTAAFAGPLTDQRVENFLASLQDMESLDARYPDITAQADAKMMAAMGGGLGGELAGEDGMVLYRTALDAIRGTQAEGAVRTIVKSHGFSSLNDWAETGDQIFTAFMALDLPELEADLADAKAEMGALPPSMQSMAAGMLGSMETMIAAARAASASDVELVRSKRDRIENAF